MATADEPGMLRRMTDQNPPGFFARLLLAYATWLRVLFDPTFAARVARLRSDDAPALPAEPPPSVTVPASAPAPLSAQDSTLLDTPRAKLLSAAGLDAVKHQSALQLLAALQRGGRLVDFLQQDVEAFPDAEIGAAARVVHDGCRRALREVATIEPAHTAEEGSRVVVNADYDRSAIKLVGDVRGAAPWRGTLRHRGWRVTKIELPELVGGHDPHVIAASEVEL